MRTNPSAQEIIEYFSNWELNPESREYINSHAWRYQFLLEEIDELIQRHQISNILDVGCAYQTELLRQIYPRLIVDTLGFEDDRFATRRIDKHIEYDLNLAQTKSYPQIDKYDLVVMAEVIEHLYTAPTLIFDLMLHILNPNGFLIIQTPNAVGLPKRLKMIVGTHPFEMLREDMKNPGHYREYTLSELKNIGIDKQFQVVSASIKNDFRSRTASNNFYNFVSHFLPASLKRGISITYKKI